MGVCEKGPHRLGVGVGWEEEDDKLESLGFGRDENVKRAAEGEKPEDTEDSEDSLETGEIEGVTDLVAISGVCVGGAVVGLPVPYTSPDAEGGVEGEETEVVEGVREERGDGVGSAEKTVDAEGCDSCERVEIGEREGKLGVSSELSDGKREGDEKYVC